MDVVDAARTVTSTLAARLGWGGELAAITDDQSDPVGWIVRQLGRAEDDEVLARLTQHPSGEAEIASVVALLIRRAASDPDFAVELVRQASTDDGSDRTDDQAAEATAIHQPVTTVSGRKAKVFIGSKVFKRRFFLIPFGFVYHIGKKAGTAAAHPAAAAVVCTVVVAGGAAGTYVLNQGSTSLAAAPVSFAGLWQGSVAESGKAGYDTELAITGGPVNGTVGSVKLGAAGICTSSLTLTQAQNRQLTINDTTTSGKCPNGTLVLVPDGDYLRYTLTHADGTVATGTLKRVQKFVDAAAAPPSSAPTPTPTPTAAPSRPSGQTIGLNACSPDPTATRQPPESSTAGTYTLPAGITAPVGAVAFQAHFVADPGKFNADPHTGLGDSFYLVGPASYGCGYFGGMGVVGDGASADPSSLPAPVAAGTEAYTSPPGAREGLEGVLMSVEATAAHGAPPCAATSSIPDPDCSVSGAELSLPTGNALVKALVEPPETDKDGYSFAVVNATTGGIAQTDGFSGGGTCYTADICATNIDLFLEQAVGSAMTSSALHDSYAAIADFIAKHPVSGAPEPGDTATDGGLPTSPPPSDAPQATASPNAAGPDCGVPTAVDTYGYHLIITSGTLTCDEAVRVLVDYNKPGTDHQGSGGYAQVDGFQCLHNSAAGNQRDGTFMQCTGSSSSFETKRPTP